VSDAVVERAQAGDAAAHEAIAVAFREPVHRYIVTMVGDPELAEDLTQETFRRCVEKLGDLRDPARLGPWLYTIAVNLCRASLRQQVDAAHPANSRPLQQEPQAGRHSVLSRVVQAESAEALAIAIDRLPILLREAFVLHLIAGLPYAEIAWITAASVEALHVRTHRAKALLRHQLGSVVDTFWSEM
jgi:RNA polymerase sigma-70 factor (ECF subfamily)